MRKAIAVTTSAFHDEEDGYKICRIVSTVICDDGSIWRNWSGEEPWYALNPIPQEPIA